MKKVDVIRAWRDGEYYASLTDEERHALPASPAAQIAIDDDVLCSVTGGCQVSFGGGMCPTSGYCTPCPPYHCSA